MKSVAFSEEGIQLMPTHVLPGRLGNKYQSFSFFQFFVCSLTFPSTNPTEGRRQSMEADWCNHRSQPKTESKLEMDGKYIWRINKGIPNI